MISTTSSMLDNITNYLFDLDGCIWYGKKLAPGAQELVNELREANCEVRFATNIASASPDDIAARLIAFGIDTSGKDILSPLSVLPYHEAFTDESTSVYLIAGETVRQFLSDAGIRIVDQPEKASVVVIGRYPKFDYNDITASMAATDSGARLLALNLDLRAPGPDGKFSLPGTGILAACLAIAGGVEAELIGKPSIHFFETGLSVFGFSRNSTVMVGDSIDSDIMGGSRAGLKTILVGAGLRARENEKDNLVKPDLTVADLVELNQNLKQFQKTP